MRAIAPHTSGCRRGAAPHLPASPTNRRRSTLGASHVIALAPWPLVLRLSPRPAWSKIRNSLPRCPHAGLGTYPRVPYVSTPRGTQGFGDRRAVLVILSCAGTRRISQHRIACSTRITRRAREKLWLPLCLMQLRGHVPPSTGRTGRNGGKHGFQTFVLLSITIIAHILLVFISIFSTSRNALG